MWMAVNGIERLQGPSPRKLPVTVRMLQNIRDRLDPIHSPNDAVLYFLIITAFFFLMRIGEYAYAGHWDYHKVLTGSDLAPKASGGPVDHFAQADEVVLWFKGSKTDQV